MLRTLSFIAHHPLTRAHPIAGFMRFARWQIESRLKPEVEFKWIDGAKMAVRNGMTGATGNIYCGLHEFADMAFVLHLLRPNDLFVDVGANIGSYTILASAVAGAQSIAVEPDPGTMVSLSRNVRLNDLTGKVKLVEAAIGARSGMARFTVGLDTMNQMAVAPGGNTRDVSVQTLDYILEGQDPLFIKLDVEGFEEDVIAGASVTLAKASLLAVATEGTDAAVLNPLREAGFVQRYYDPFSRMLTVTPKYPHSNALFVRDEAKILQRLAAAPRRMILGQSL